MLETLSGTLVRKDADQAVLDVAGIGFLLSVPASTSIALPAEGNTVRLFVHLSFNMQEGEFTLYGFATEIERTFFRTLLGISGFGPRKGLMLLSQVKIADFSQAICDRNLAYLSALKGVGRKTAERLLVELRESMLQFSFTTNSTGQTGAATTGDETIPALPVGENISDAVAGLVALGCRYSQAANAVSKAAQTLGTHAKAAELIREGLKYR